MAISARGSCFSSPSIQPAEHHVGRALAHRGEARLAVEDPTVAGVAHLVARRAVVEVARGHGARAADQRAVARHVLDHLRAVRKGQEAQEVHDQEVHVQRDGGGAVGVRDLLHHAHHRLGAHAEAAH